MKRETPWFIKLILHLGLYVLYRLVVWNTLGTRIIEITNKESDSFSIRIGRYLLFFSIGMILFYIVGELLAGMLAKFVLVSKKRCQAPYIVLTHFLLFSAYYLHVSYVFHYISLYLMFRDDEDYQACYRRYMTYVILAIIVILFLMIWHIFREGEGIRARSVHESPIRIIIHLALCALLSFAWPVTALTEYHDSYVTLVMGLLRSQYILFSVCFLLLYFGGEILYRETAGRDCSHDSLFSSIWSFLCYMSLFYIGLRRITNAVYPDYIPYRINSSDGYHVSNMYLQDGRLAWLWFAYGVTILTIIVVLFCMPHGTITEYSIQSQDYKLDSVVNSEEKRQVRSIYQSEVRTTNRSTEQNTSEANRIIKTTANYRYSLLVRNGEYFFTFSDGKNVDYVRTPMGKPVSTKSVELAERIFQDIDRYGTDINSSKSILPWHVTAMDSFLGESREKLLWVFNLSFFQKSDWTFMINQSREEWNRVFGKESERKEETKRWIENCNPFQLTAACFIGQKYNSLNVSYVLARIAEKEDYLLREQEYKSLAQMVIENPFIATKDDVLEDFKQFEFYYNLKEGDNHTSEKECSISTKNNEQRNKENTLINLFLSEDPSIAIDDEYVGVCLREYINLKSEYGEKMLVSYQRPKFTIVPELLQAGQYTVMNYLHNRSIQSELKDNTYRYYSIMLQYAFESGLVYAYEWHKSHNTISQAYIDKVFRETPVKKSKSLLKMLGLKNEDDAARYYNRVLDEFIKLSFNTNDSKKEQDVKICSGVYAFYLFGSFLMLIKLGY
ncbi:MAG: hypothetical protein IKI01_02555 [Lachnospiraceae bacterium]|nr:hypothetical protein [Lachnospiraceae bacterium]